MAKRPSTPSIRARQKRLLEYIGQTGRSNRQVAKEFGVTSKQLGEFVGSSPKELRTKFRRSPSYPKLYEGATEKELRSKARGHGQRIEFRPLSAYSEPSIQQVRTNPKYTAAYQSQYTVTGEQIQYLYTQRVTPQYAWARYTQEHGLPVQSGRNFIEYRRMRRTSQLSPQAFHDAYVTWAQIYGIEIEGFDPSDEFTGGDD